MGKEFACNAGGTRDTSLSPVLERSPGEGNGNPLQYSYMGNPMSRSLAGYSPWGHKRVGHNLATKQRHFGQRIVFFIHHITKNLLSERRKDPLLDQERK